jgi:hypothetical protein
MQKSYHRTSLHEASHAVIANYLNIGVKEIHVGYYGGYVELDFTYRDVIIHNKNLSFRNKKYLLYKFSLISLAGYVAEILMLPSSKKHLKRCRTNSIIDLGMIRENVEYAYKNFEKPILSIMLADTYKLVGNLKPIIRRVAKTLNKCKKINRKEFLLLLSKE